MSHLSIGGAKYFVQFIDDHTRYVHIYFLKQKSDAPNYFKNYKNLVENQLDLKIKALRSDNGTEYFNKQVSDFTNQHGIIHQSTIPHTPQQNGVAERYNRTELDKVTSMLNTSNTPKNFWAEAAATAV